MLSSIVDCPFCGSWNKLSDIPTEDSPVDSECRECGRSLTIHVRVVTSYYAQCGEAEHDWEHHTAWPTLDFCKRCYASRSHQ